MSTSNSKKNSQAIEQASIIIERFGGIRPMAKKMGVAVTTVQGWKKRDTIPANRRKTVIETAITQDIDISDIIPDAIQEAMPSFVTQPQNNDDDAFDDITTNTTDTDKASTQQHTAATEHATAPVQPITPTRANDTDFTVPKNDLDEKLNPTVKKSGAGVWITVSLIALIGAGAGYFLFNNNEDLRTKFIQEQEQESKGFLSTLVPSNLDERIKSLQEQTGLTDEKINNTINTARTISANIADSDTLAEGAARIQEHAQDLADIDFVSYFGLESMKNAITMFKETPRGQKILKLSVQEINELMASVHEHPESLDVDEQLAMGQLHLPGMSRTFKDVPLEDIKAAAVLLAFTQFRDSTNRTGEPFGRDLQALNTLVGNVDPELNASIMRLAPYARSGVLTPSGLSKELQTIAGDAVVASIQGEDVSISDKIKDRIGEVVQIEKDGQTILGTTEKSDINKAQNLIKQGNIGAAIKVIENLNGPAAKAFKPWIKQAQGTLHAQETSGLLKSILSGKTLSTLGLGKGRLIRDKTGATNVYIPK